MTDVWTYREPSWATNRDLVGFDVEATDGSIGTIDKATYDASDAYVVVDTGFWIFGKKRVIPAGTVVGIDHESKTVQVGLTKDEVRSAPDYDSEHWDEAARTRHGDYYRTYVR
jgi:hypothetical protein